MDRWRDRVAVVTGGSEGIGGAIVRRLAAEGMKVVALARREETLRELEEELTEKKLYVRGKVCDVSDDEQVSSVFKWIEDNVGPVSMLVNNAAYYKYIRIPDLDMSTIRSHVDTNLTGLLGATIHGLRSMKENNIDDGHIININSGAGHYVGTPGGSLYSATKHGVTVLSQALKTELAEENSKIRVTSISPGLVKTTMAQSYMDKYPGLNHLQPDDIADAVLYAISAPANVNIAEMFVFPT